LGVREISRKTITVEGMKVEIREYNNGNKYIYPKTGKPFLLRNN